MSADLRRLQYDRLRDFLSGLVYPGGHVGAFAEPSAAGRPQLGEQLAQAFSPWPGTTAEYSHDGSLQNPGRWLFGQNVATAMALGFAEVRAFLLGLTQGQDVSRALATQYYRFGQALGVVLPEQLPANDGEGLGQAEYNAVLRRLFSLGADWAELQEELQQLQAQITSVDSSIPVLDPDLVALAALTGTGFAARTGSNMWALRSLQAPAAGFTISNPAGTGGDPTFTLSNDLAALEALSGLGLATRIGTDAWAVRSLQAPASGFTIANPAGTGGDPSFTLSNDLAALEALSGLGLATRTGTDAWAVRSLQAPASGFTIANPAGTGGDPSFTLSNDLAALEALATVGFAVRTAADTWAIRALTAGPGVSITNADGVAGNPQIGLPTTGVTSGSYPLTGQIPTFTASTLGLLTAAGSTTDGSGLTGLNAAGITTGTMSSARLPVIPKTLGGFGVDISTGLTNDQVAIVSGGALTIGPLTAAAMLLAPLVVSANTTLTAANRYVFCNNTGGAIALTLPLTPATGTLIEIVQVATTFNQVAISPQFPNTLFGSSGSIHLSGFCSPVRLMFDGTNWQVLNLRRQTLNFVFPAASANAYIQRDGTVGTLGAAKGVYSLGSGLTIVSGLRLQTRGSVAADHTIQVRRTAFTFATDSALLAPLSATITTGTSGASAWARNVISTPTITLTGDWLVLQASTAITSIVDVVLELYTL